MICKKETILTCFSFFSPTLHSPFIPYNTTTNTTLCKQYALGKHRSNALELVHQYPVVEVDGDMAICDGGGGALGHPIEYISLARGGIEYCKYCSLRYQQKAGSHGGHH
jgi:NADH dehydrogenase (ubiquinone) Fe-S protein 6